MKWIEVEFPMSTRPSRPDFTSDCTLPDSKHILHPRRSDEPVRSMSARYWIFNGILSWFECAYFPSTPQLREFVSAQKFQDNFNILLNWTSCVSRRCKSLLKKLQRVSILYRCTMMYIVFYKNLRFQSVDRERCPFLLEIGIHSSHPVESWIWQQLRQRHGWLGFVLDPRRNLLFGSYTFTFPFRKRIMIQWNIRRK